MSKIIHFLLFPLLLLIISTLLQSIQCRSAARNDLIDGNEFLSLFIEPVIRDKDNNYDDLDENHHIPPTTDNNRDFIEKIETIDPLLLNDDELLVQDATNYDLHLNDQKFGQKISHRHDSIRSSSIQEVVTKSLPSSSDSTIIRNGLDKSTTVRNIIANTAAAAATVTGQKNNGDFNNKQVIKFVTSGSKIVFLEEITPPASNDSNKSSSKNQLLTGYDRHKEFDDDDNNSDERKFNSTALSSTSATTTTSANSDSDEIQVISIRVSSTTVAKAARSNQGNIINTNSKPDDLGSFTPAEPIQGNDNLFDDDNISSGSSSISSSSSSSSRRSSSSSSRSSSNNSRGDNKNDFINRSHKSEFSIEESEPVTQQTTVSDSINGESTNIHSIIAPPRTINQSPHLHMTDQAVSAAGAAPDGATNSGGGRMQRKQDKLVPFQTVIYHDTEYNKDGSTQPRSVSYSSLAQSVDELNTWKDLDSFLEAKKNVSEVLMPIPHQQQASKTFPPQQSAGEKVYSEPAKFYSEPAKMYGEPSKFYSEPAKVYSEPAKMYGQPEKQYGQPSKVYSEPSKVYSEPAKTYSEPAKVYGEPSKVYWPPALTTTSRPTTTTTKTTTTATTTTKSPRRIIFNLDKLPYDLLNAPESSKRLLESDLSVDRKLHPGDVSSIPKTQQQDHHQQQHQQNQQQPLNNQLNKNMNTITVNFNSGQRVPNPTVSAFPNHQHHNNQHHHHHQNHHHHHHHNHRDHLVTENPNFTTGLSSAVTRNSQEIYTPTPEQNYEIEESVSVMTNGRAHGVQPPIVPPTPNPTDESKVGYVVEGRNFRKYRVEEKTDDGFIVGEYGVVSHNDDSIRGVRYTADSNINPSLIHEALMKFLSL